jgi:palmitoyltransferase
MAVELKSLGAWKRALEEGGFTEDGSKRKKPLSEVGVHTALGQSVGTNSNVSPQRNTKLAVFFMPAIFLYMMFTTLTVLPWYTGTILAMAEFFGMHHVGVPPTCMTLLRLPS